MSKSYAAAMMALLLSACSPKWGAEQESFFECATAYGHAENLLVDEKEAIGQQAVEAAQSKCRGFLEKYQGSMYSNKVSELLPDIDYWRDYWDTATSVREMAEIHQFDKAIQLLEDKKDLLQSTFDARMHYIVSSKHEHEKKEHEREMIKKALAGPWYGSWVGLPTCEKFSKGKIITPEDVAEAYRRGGNPLMQIAYYDDYQVAYGIWGGRVVAAMGLGKQNCHKALQYIGRDGRIIWPGA